MSLQCNQPYHRQLCAMAAIYKWLPSRALCALSKVAVRGCCALALISRQSTAIARPCCSPSRERVPWWASMTQHRCRYYPPAQLPRAGWRALVVGLGGGILPRFLLNTFGECSVDVVELDPVVVSGAPQLCLILLALSSAVAYCAVSSGSNLLWLRPSFGPGWHREALSARC